jgi:hypothetical protein
MNPRPCFQALQYPFYALLLFYLVVFIFSYYKNPFYYPYSAMAAKSDQGEGEEMRDYLHQ